jgi:hypothetical protein
MEVRSTRSCETNGCVGNPRNPPDPKDPNVSGRAERALAEDRLIEYLSGGHEWGDDPATTARREAGKYNGPLQIVAPSATRASERLLPVGRFSPSPGLIVDRTGTSVVVSGLMELYGSEANASRATMIQQAINTTWTRTFEDGYSITCGIAVRYRAPGSRPAEATQIEAAKTLAPSKVSRGLHGYVMTLDANEQDAFTWAPAHEFGHILGLKDRYSESIMGRVRGAFGGSRTTTPRQGYAGNLMAETGGTLSAQNVADVAAENAPSPYWIHDDDQVAAWISAHSTAEIGKLSTADKLRAIRTLQGGWVSAQDLAAIERICSSVRSRTEGEAIRRGVDILEFSDLGQRTQMRVFLAKMP